MSGRPGDPSRTALDDGSRKVTTCAVQPPALNVALVDLAQAGLVEISVGLFEHETAGLRMESWPAPVQQLIEREVESWQLRNKASRLLALTTAVVAAGKGRCCVALLHHAPK